jgi:hypothetical protein
MVAKRQMQNPSSPRAGKGRSVLNYRKDQIIFTQGDHVRTDRRFRAGPYTPWAMANGISPSSGLGGGWAV